MIQPSQQAAGGQQSGGGKIDRIAKTCVDQALDRLLQSGKVNQFPHGIGDNIPAARSIQDASAWTETQKQEFIQYQQDKVRAARYQASIGNQQDSFRILGQTKATFFGKADQEEEKAEYSEENIMERIIEAARLQEAKNILVRKEREIEKMKRNQTKYNMGQAKIYFFPGVENTKQEIQVLPEEGPVELQAFFI